MLRDLGSQVACHEKVLVAAALWCFGSGCAPGDRGTGWPSRFPIDNREIGDADPEVLVDAGRLTEATPTAGLEIRSYRGDINRRTAADLTASAIDDVNRFLLDTHLAGRHSGQPCYVRATRAGQTP